ncbi:hypothetical protein NL676_018194 [Syzygium grande]|nr:hypothetical protein NL676_018194 [Syzygium grande]
MITSYGEKNPPTRAWGPDPCHPLQLSLEATLCIYMVIRYKGFYSDEDEGEQQADEQPTGKAGKEKAVSSGAEKRCKLLSIFSRYRGGGVSKVEKAATGQEGTEAIKEQQEHKNEKRDQLVSPTWLNSNHGTKDICIDSIPRTSTVITRDKGKLKDRNGEEKINEYVVASPQGHELWYAKESPYNQKKNETERASTVVLRTGLHCDGCIQEIEKCISSYKGVESVAIDASKDQVSVTGVVEMKEFVSYLQDKIKRNVEVVSTRRGVDKEFKERVDKGGLGGALYDVSSSYGVLQSQFNFLIFYDNCYYPTNPS